MALYAKRESYIQQPAVPQNPTREPAKKRNLITKGEKVLYLSFVAVFVLCALLILQNQSVIQASAQEIQTIEHTIDEKVKQNTDLAVQVKEASTYEVIWAKANELGLKLNEQNVKVVPVQ